MSRGWSREKKKKKKPHRDLSGYAGGSLVCWHISGSWLFTACKLSETCDRAAELKDKKKSLKKEQEQIKEQKEYRKTDQYVEDVAREKFGLVYDNEIVFKAE